MKEIDEKSLRSGMLIRRLSSLSHSRNHTALPHRQADDKTETPPDGGRSPSPPAGPMLIQDPNWADMDMVEKRAVLKSVVEDGDKTQLTPAKFRTQYEAAVKDCVYDNEDNEKTIVHYLIRAVEKNQFRDSKLYRELLEISLNELSVRLGSSALGDSFHEAIKRKHFELIKFICSKAETPEFKELVSEAIASKSNKRNCLHAIIAEDPRYIEVVRTLVWCADSEAFEAKQESTHEDSNGNTPLHDFVKFSGKRFMICQCKCKSCTSPFPDSVRDEGQYTRDFVETLQRMIAKFPGALSTTNKGGKTPYVVHLESRRQIVTDQFWDGVEYGPIGHGGQPTDASAKDQSQAITVAPGLDISLGRQSASNQEAQRGITSDAHSRSTPRSPTPTGHRPGNLKGLPPKKGSPSATEKGPARSSNSHDERAWRYSRHLAQKVAMELLEACSSRPSWEEAKNSIFGDRQSEDHSTIQTSFMMEDALYKDIEKEYDFLDFNSILAHVELHLACPHRDASLDLDAIATADLGVHDMIDAPKHLMTPEQARSRNVDYLRAVFKWLGEKGVKRILKLVVVDNQEWQCSDETIEECLKPWDIRYLDWNKRDLSIEIIRQGHAGKLVELWLTWSGQNTALRGWSDPVYGLKQQLPQLKEVHIDVHSSVESVARMKSNLDAFEKRVGKRTEEMIVVKSKIVKRFDGLRFIIPDNLRTGSNGPSKVGHRGSQEQRNESHHRWMDAVCNFREQVTASYNILRPTSPERRIIDENPIKIALIDDGVTPSKLHFKGKVKGGWPRDRSAGHREISTYYNSMEGHGTTMANLIHYVCPFVHLYVAKLEKSPPKPYRSVAHMAAEAVKWAVSQKVDVISMSWTIQVKPEHTNDGAELTKQIQEAEKKGIALFCSSNDTGAHDNDPNQLLPAKSTLLRRVGSCNGNGNKSEFVNTTDLHYLFPGEQLSIMQQHVRGKAREAREAGEAGQDRGSSASTALAAGLASLVLWCTVRSGGDRKEFANKRMYALFDGLKSKQSDKTASLVDVSGLMNEIRARGDPAPKTIATFVERLREVIPVELRHYHESKGFES